jgi:glycosyltransferase involved in cell wall biosynthesis
MKFSIVTPSFRQLGWLKRCARSIGDQQGAEFEHIIQDAGTGPELDEWVRANTQAQLFVEKDSGMYDAINRGLSRATGDILAFLNCDEQYLPGTLEAVAKEFEAHPEIDFLVGDFLIVDGTGQLLSFRRVTKLRKIYVMRVPLAAYTCGTFIRRRVWDAGLRYRTDLKDIADGEFMISMLQRGYRHRVLRRFLSVFADTGANRSKGEVAKAEKRAALARHPLWMRMITPLLHQMRRVEKFFAGGYSSGSIAYDIYTSDDAETRTHLVCEKPSGVFREG